MTKLKSITGPELTANFYCYKSDNGAVFLDRKDRVIKRFQTYSEAVKYATGNIHLIDQE